MRLAEAFCAEEGTGPCRLSAEILEAHAFGPDAVVRLQVAPGLLGGIIGYALYYPGFDSIGARKGFYLADLFVRAQSRRQGVGRALMVAVARDCRAAGGSWLTWNAMTRNRNARAFYARLGAREHPLVTLSLDTTALDRLLGQE